MQPNPRWTHLSKWNFDLEIWSLQRSKVPTENFLYELTVKVESSIESEMFLFYKRKYKTWPKYSIMLLKGRSYSLPGNSGFVAGGGSAPQLVHFVTTGGFCLTLGSFHHWPTHQHISLSSQPDVPGCDFKEWFCLMCLSVAAHSDVTEHITDHHCSFIPRRPHQEDHPQKHPQRALCETGRSVCQIPQAPKMCEGP